MSYEAHPCDSVGWSDVDLLLSDLDSHGLPLTITDNAHDFHHEQNVATAQSAATERQCDAHQSTLQRLPHGPSPLPSPRLSKKALLKERNRQAQARYRQRKLVRFLDPVASDVDAVSAGLNARLSQRIALNPGSTQCVS